MAARGTARREVVERKPNWCRRTVGDCGLMRRKGLAIEEETLFDVRVLKRVQVGFCSASLSVSLSLLCYFRIHHVTTGRSSGGVADSSGSGSGKFSVRSRLDRFNPV